LFALEHIWIRYATLRTTELTRTSATRWKIRYATGLENAYVACSFIAATVAFERGDPAEI
jgi:hypothetical protein